MMNILDLYNNGTIKFLYNKGMISIDVLCYFEYVEYYNKRRSSGINYTNAVLDTADKYQISISTVKRAIRTIK